MPIAALRRVALVVARRVVSRHPLESLTAVFGAAPQAHLRNPLLSHLGRAFRLSLVSLTLAFAVVLSPWPLPALGNLSE